MSRRPDTRPTPVLIQGLISLPERVQPGDFVLRLSEGVSEAGAAATLRDYVVAPDLARNFDTALGAIKSALDSRSSKAGYLHGSFGSGKSHFMAVLFLLLKGHPHARAIAELAPALLAHEAWLGRKKVLCVPFHMIGAKSMEHGRRRCGPRWRRRCSRTGASAWTSHSASWCGRLCFRWNCATSART